MFTAYRFPSVFSRRNISDASGGYNKCNDLALGRQDMRFVLFFVNEGFHFRYTKPILYFRKTYHASGQDHHAHITVPQEVWNLIWKIKIPLKIGIIVWKDMHDSIPTFLNLCNRGINVHSTCPLCNSEDESTTHLFLYCPFALAWFIIGYSYFCAKQCFCPRVGWVLADKTQKDGSGVNEIPANSVYYLMVDMEPWNLAVHEDKQPNPIEMLITAQNLSCRYHEIFNEADLLDTQRHQQNTDQIPIGGQWQLIVKLAGAKRKRTKRSAYAYEARNIVFH